MCSVQMKLSGFEGWQRMMIDAITRRYRICLSDGYMGGNLGEALTRHGRALVQPSYSSD